MSTNSASVLVVDDDVVAENRDLLVRRLKRRGIADVEQAVNGGDALLVVTDGFTEAADPGGALFGDARVETFLAALDPRSPGALEDALAALIKDVRNFEAGEPASDDIAAMLLSVA